MKQESNDLTYCNDRSNIEWSDTCRPQDKLE